MQAESESGPYTSTFITVVFVCEDKARTDIKLLLVTELIESGVCVCVCEC